jgi:hypothetical protein
LSDYSRKKRKREAEQTQQVQPWISLKTGRRIILAVSLGMAILTAMQVIPQRGAAEGILLGVIFGGLIWVIFEGYTLLNRFLRRFR